MNVLRHLPACALLVLAAPSFAQSLREGSDDASVDEFRLRIARLPLPAALKEFSRQTGLQVGYLPRSATDDAALSAPLKGRYTAEAALRQLLAPSGLTFERVNERTIAVTTPEAATSGAPGDRVRIGPAALAAESRAPHW